MNATQKLSTRETAELIESHFGFSITTQGVRQWVTKGTRGKRLKTAGRKGNRYLFYPHVVIDFVESLNNPPEEDPEPPAPARTKTKRAKRAEARAKKTEAK